MSHAWGTLCWELAWSCIRWKGLRGRGVGIPFRSYKSNQEKDGKRAPFRDEMTHLRRIISAFPSGLALFSQRSQSFQNCLRDPAGLMWSLWSRSLPGLDCQRGLQSTEEGTGLLSSVLEPPHNQQVLSSPLCPCEEEQWASDLDLWQSGVIWLKVISSWIFPFIAES